MFKEEIRKDNSEANSPLEFLDYCDERGATITNMTAKNIFQLQGQNDHTATYGEQGDISNICQFGWCEWVYVRDGLEPFPLMTEVLGHCLEPAQNEENEMAQWILKINGQVVPRRSLRNYALMSLPMNQR